MKLVAVLSVAVLLLAVAKCSWASGTCDWSERLCSASCYFVGCWGGGVCDDNNDCICDCPHLSCVLDGICWTKCYGYYGCQTGKCNAQRHCECINCPQPDQLLSGQNYGYAARTQGRTRYPTQPRGQTIQGRGGQ